MNQAIDVPQGTFRAPRIPFDFKSVLLGALGFSILRLIDVGLGSWWEVKRPFAQLVALLGAQINRIAFLGGGFGKGLERIWGGPFEYSLSWWQAILAGVLFLGVWGILGGAILRIAALRLTRDEPLSLREALAFGGRNLKTFLLAPILVIVFAAFFALCNALAGLLIAIPVLGSWVLVWLLFPLALISSLLIVLSLLAGIVGLPLMWAGITVEQNGALEALSRSFSYIFARPFQFFFTYLLLFILMSAVLLTMSYFESAAKSTVRLGIWRTGLKELVAYEQQPSPEANPAGMRWQQELYQEREQKRRGIADFHNIHRARWMDWTAFLAMWAALWVFLVSFKGYALYLLLGGTLSLYLHLRKDVDGTDEDEIYLGDEESPPPEGPEEARWVGEDKSAESPQAKEPEDKAEGGEAETGGES